VRVFSQAREDFAEVAKQVSEDPNAKSNGGFYPETAPGRMGEEFDSRMFSQSIDEVSEPFRTPAGWHLLKVIATHDKGPHLFKEVQQKLSAMMIEAKHREALLGVVSEARKKMKVEVLYTPRLAASEAKP
jgi:parvulin-like peptidyl-prolyl isomerase